MIDPGWVGALEDRELSADEMRDVLYEIISTVNTLSSHIMGLEARIEELERLCEKS